MQQTYITKGFFKSCCLRADERSPFSKSCIKKKRHIKNIKLFLDINGSIIPQS